MQDQLALCFDNSLGRRCFDEYFLAEHHPLGMLLLAGPSNHAFKI